MKRRITKLLESNHIQWPILACSLFITLLVSYLSFFENQQQSIVNFNNQVYKIERTLSSSLLTYEQVLLGSVGLFNITEDVTAKKWNQYINTTTKYVKNSYPGIKGIGFVKKVSKDQLANYVEKLKKDSGNNHYLYKNKDYFYIVTYLEPLTKENKKIIGFDLSTESNRDFAMRMAEYTGESALTHKVKLLTGEEGFLMFMPVYSKKSVTTEERKENLIGFVFTPFISDIFINNSLEPLRLNIGVNIYEGRKVDNSKLIYASNHEYRIKQNSKFYFEKTYINYGKQFTMVFYPMEEFYKSFTYNWFIILVIGMITSLLSFYLVCSLVETNQKARKIAFEMTQELRKSKENLEKLAHYDSLTGLANRFYFTQSLSHAINLALRHNYKVALLFIDLDGFKGVNDKFGHEAGDIVLKEVAIRIEGCLREVDLVGRLGGDEFVVLIENVDSEKNFDSLRKVADNIIKTINKPIVHIGSKIEVGVSIGIAISPDDGKEISILMKNADRAMYDIKQSGKNNFSICCTK